MVSLVKKVEKEGLERMQSLRPVGVQKAWIQKDDTKLQFFCVQLCIQTESGSPHCCKRRVCANLS